MTKFRWRTRKGIGLLQVVFSVFIATALTSLVSPTLQKLSDQSKRVLVDVDKEQLAVALEHYYRDQGFYPEGDNVNMVQALKDKYISFASETLKNNIFDKAEFVDPWGRPYLYHYKKGDKSYHLRFQGMPERPLFGLPKPLFKQETPNRLGAGASSESEVQPSVNIQPVEIDNNESDLGQNDVSVPDEPEALDLLPLHAIPNDRLVFVTVENVALALDRVLMNRKVGTGEFSDLPLRDFDANGNIIWFEGSTVVNVLDFNVQNSVSYAYKGEFWIDSLRDQTVATREGSAVPSEEFVQDLAQAKALLDDATLEVEGQYGVSTKDIFATLVTHNVPIIWGYKSRLESSGGFEESTLGYTLSFSDRVTGEFREFIVVNTLELKDEPLSMIASLLAHEGIHHYWNHQAPELPKEVAESLAPDDSTPRGDAGRSFNSVDEEYEAFLMSLRFWKQAQGDDKNETFDQLLALLNGPNGEKELRDYMRTVYHDLDEY